jgi:hypothetical protein
MAMAAAALAGAGLSGRRPKRRLPDPFLLCVPDMKPLPLGISALYLDLDGVFADFERAVFEFLGKKPNEMRARDMWPPLAQLKYPGFSEACHQCLVRTYFGSFLHLTNR